MKFYYLFVFAALGLFMTGCDDDDDPDHNHEDEQTITITIEEPVDGETITDCADVHIHVDFLASDENHEIAVVLHPEGNTSDKIIDYSEHEHDASVSFEQEVDLCSYPAGTCFHLEVESCIDHDCTEVQSAEAEFCLAE